MYVVQYRLDNIAEAGIPLWITELDVQTTNVTERALHLVEMLTLYFSHPAIEGIMLWGFWDGTYFEDRHAELVEGDDFVVRLH